eukprot:713075-Prorocentrum_lima.AAC.1
MAKKQVTVVKIKAHQSHKYIDTLPLASRLPAKGNQAADLAAKKGVWGHEGLKDWLSNNCVYLQL